MGEAKIDTKPVHKSLTIQAAGIIALLQMAPEIVAELDKIIPADITTDPVVIKVLTFCAVVVAIYGRIRATAKIGGKQ